MKTDEKIQWFVQRDEIKHEDGGTQVILVLETLNTVSVDAGKITKLINEAAPEVIGLTVLSECQ